MTMQTLLIVLSLLNLAAAMFWGYQMRGKEGMIWTLAFGSFIFAAIAASIST
jgi:hypothetical protein